MRNTRVRNLLWPFCQSTLSSTAPSSGACLRCSVSDRSGQEAASSAASFTSSPSESAEITESLWVLMAASGCVYGTVCVHICVCVCVAVCNVLCLYACVRECNWTGCLSVMLQRVGLDGRRRVIQSVCVVCGLSGQRARVGQRSRSAITEKP